MNKPAIFSMVCHTNPHYLLSSEQAEGDARKLRFLCEVQQKGGEAIGVAVFGVFCLFAYLLLNLRNWGE